MSIHSYFKTFQASCLYHSWILLAPKTLETQRIDSNLAFIKEWLSNVSASVWSNMVCACMCVCACVCVCMRENEVVDVDVCVYRHTVHMYWCIWCNYLQSVSWNVNHIRTFYNIRCFRCTQDKIIISSDNATVVQTSFHIRQYCFCPLWSTAISWWRT